MPKTHILVLTTWSLQDALIQTYTLPYVRIIKKYLPAGSKIYLQTLEQGFYKTDQNSLVKMRAQLHKEGIEWIRLRYTHFGPLALFFYLTNFLSLWVNIFSKRVTYIHAWCTPAGSMGYLLSLFTGRRLILDSFEPHAEPMVDTHTWKSGSFAHKLLFKLEGLQSRRADSVIAVAEGMREYASKNYHADFDNFWVKPACVDLHKFSFQNIKNPKLLAELGLEDKLVCVYAGKLGGIYLEGEVFDFFKQASKFWGDRFRVLMLTSHSETEISSYCADSGFNKEHIVIRYIPHAQIADYMGLGDFAITPIKPIPSKRISTPIKDGEYWALGLPVVITPNISNDSELIEKNGVGAILHSLDEAGYQKAVQQIDDLLRSYTREQLYEKIRRIAEEYRSFAIAHQVYKDIYQAAS